MKNKNLFLFGVFLISSSLVFNVNANESNVVSKIDAKSIIVESSSKMIDEKKSSMSDDGSDNSGTYNIGEGDIGQPIPGVNDKKENVDKVSNVIDTEVKSKKEVKPEKKPEKDNNVDTNYNQFKFESSYYDPKNVTIENTNVTKQEDSVLSNNEQDFVEKLISYDETTLETNSNNIDNNEVGELIDLRTINKPIGKITRLKPGLPSTGMLNTKQGAIASLFLMLFGLIFLLHGFSRKYLG